MTNAKATKRALMSSVLALLLCISMLLGTTYAWFTDDVKSGSNVIESGNLDVEVEYTLDGKTWNNLAGAEDLFQKGLWEPGHTEVVALRIVNNGELALKYVANMNIFKEIVGKTKTNQDIVLSNILQVSTFDVAIDANGNADSFLAAAFADDEGQGVAWRGPVAFNKSNILDSGIVLLEDEAHYLIVKVDMPESVGNEANHDGKNKPSIEFGIDVLATQFTYEKDTFGPEYDQGAALPWDGSVDLSWYDPTATTYELYSAEALAGLAALVNGNATSTVATLADEGTTTLSADSFNGKVVKLSTDVDLSDIAWTPIGACNTSTYFRGTFDGQGHTISGLNVDKSTDGYKYTTAGLFGWVDAASATVQNLKVDGATVKGSHWVGVIAGYWTGNIINCTVTNSTVEAYNVNDDANGDKVGGIVGYVNSGAGKLDGNTVSNCKITGYRDIGGLAGAVAVSNTVTNNKVEKTVITYTTDHVGAIVSPKTTVVVDDTNVATDVSIGKALSASTPSDLAGALNGYDNEIADKHISIVLSEDLTISIGDLGNITGGSGQYKLGGDETESITIDLNGHKLTISTTYWSILGAKNPNAVFTIKNGSMNSSQTSGTWNSYDLGFNDCKFVFENVTFDKAIALESDATLKNVTINESHDYYALWIPAKGQTVEIDGLTINSAGRGIKIDEQYVDAPSKVDLKISNADINTVNKAAIVVKSAAGADITLSDVDIANTLDTAHAVWVDEDADAYADLVTVTGGEVISEASVILKAADFEKAIESGKTELYVLGEGNFKMPGNNTSATVKIIGNNAAVIDMTWGAYWDYATVTFENVIFETTFGKVNGNGSDYAAFYSKNVTYNNCTFNGGMLIGRDGATFNGCTFNITSDYLRAYGNDATFDGCTFNTVGKAILIYSDGGNEISQVTVKNCNFNASVGAKASAIANQNCAAIEIHNYGNGVNLVTENNTIGENFSGEWRIKTYETGRTKVIVNGTEYTQIAIDGKLMTIDANKNVTVNP